ncbi:hypothetical protein Pla175_25240 [Pirellulimonas nuda]|uniref:DUF1772 domain-containing protein n=1 Tax=Pirellulimonas nuda TaxID=2528009 RepID=A0A518DCC9_9BACT|nr:DUF1772 domain-containing protein [Pirellulimonas nuda]QDU89137.1 hypothetical protein Pla175_25240 [Pirellulimonas nuda]
MTAYAWLAMIVTFLSALKAGFLFAFAIVVMPGISKLDDHEFLRCFQTIDRVIQRGQPMFMTMWLGSSLTLVAAAVLALTSQSRIDQVVMVSCAAGSVLLVQLPTTTINIPLINQVQALDIQSLGDAQASEERFAFESRWNRWNTIRTVVTCLILAALLLLMLRIEIG